MDIRRIRRAFIANWCTVFSILTLISLRLLEGKNLYSVLWWSSAFIQIVIALLLFPLSQTYGIIRRKSLLPTFFYLLFVGTNPLLFNNLSGSILTILIITCLFFLFATYQNLLPQLYAFNIAILITIGSLYWFPLLLFFPLFWYGMYLLKSLNHKSFFAYFLGIFVVYLFLWTLNVFLGVDNDLSVFLKNVFIYKDLQIVHMFSFELQEWIIYGFLIIFLFLSGLKVFSSDISEKTRTIIILRYLWVLSCILFVLSFMLNQWKSEWLLILYIPVSLLVAYFFTFSKSKFVLWLLLIVIIGFLILFLYLENILERFILYFLNLYRLLLAHH